MTQYDVVIRNGTIVDGTGGPPRPGDLAIDGNRIAAVGEVSGRGAQEIDAGGHLVLPGWVDVHTHYDGQVTWDPYLTPSTFHGVTTVVMGNCGVGFAPVRPDKHQWLIELMEGVEDIPGTALHEGITWGWETFPEYLDALDRLPLAVDVGTQVPHGALRGYVMGDRGADHTAVPTGDEVAHMGRLAAEAIEAGALGFTTSRTVAHRSADGRHTPSLTATRAELLGIARAIGATGKGVFEVVADLVDLDSEFELFRAMVAASGRPMSITTLQRRNCPPDEYTRILKLIADAADSGLAMWGQVAARPVGIILSLDGTSNPLRTSPTYERLASLDLPQRVTEMRKADVRSAIIAELEAMPSDTNPLCRNQYTFRLSDPPRYDPAPNESLNAEAERRGVSIFEMAYDVLTEAEGPAMIYAPSTNYIEGDMRAVRDMIVHPNTVPGLGDAGAHCTMISDGSFPTYMLSYWGRDAPADARLPVEWIVKQQCADTAALVGLGDRGVLQPGYRADVNVVDFDHLSIGVPVMRHDLPAGGKRLVQQAAGYVTTLVGGEVAFHDGASTGVLAGHLLRGSRPAPVPA